MIAGGEHDAALIAFGRCIALDPGITDAHIERAHILLARGDWAEGWAEYEWRLRRPAIAVRRPAGVPPWDGSPLPDGTLLVHTLTDGCGDVIMMARYLDLARRRVGRIVVACQRPLLRLLSALPAVDLAFDLWGDEPPGLTPTAEVAMMSLPGVLGAPPDAIPPAPYLAIDPAIRDAWSYWISDIPGRKVGVAWQGDPAHYRDRSRSFALTELAPLAAVPGVSLISLQQGHGVEQIGGAGFPVLDLGPNYRSNDWLDTAALMGSLDLVIACDTAVAHLAGAAGVPTWIALPDPADWRWAGAETRTPWYDSARIFRQPRAGDWGSVFGEISRSLAER